MSSHLVHHIAKASGLALLGLILASPVMLPYAALKALCFFVRRHRRHAWAREILSCPRYPGDELYREIAENALKS